MKYIIVFILVIAVASFFTKNDNQTIPDFIDYELLKEKKISENKKISVLIKDTIYDTQQIDNLIKNIKKDKYQNDKCIIELWTNKKAFELEFYSIVDNLPDSSYIFMANHLIATHYCFIPETVMFEYQDEKYNDLVKKLDH